MQNNERRQIVDIVNGKPKARWYVQAEEELYINPSTCIPHHHLPLVARSPFRKVFIMSVTPSLSSQNLSASQTTASALDTRSIEEIMCDLYLTAYDPANKTQVVEGFDIFQNLAAFLAFTSSAQHPQHRFLDQRLMEGPNVVYVAQQAYDVRNPMKAITGKKTLSPMVPILKANYFDVEASNKIRKDKFISDDVCRYTSLLNLKVLNFPICRFRVSSGANATPLNSYSTHLMRATRAAKNWMYVSVPYRISSTVTLA